MPNEIKPVIVADDGINRSIKPVIVADDGINKVKKKEVSQSTEKDGRALLVTQETARKQRSESSSQDDGIYVNPWNNENYKRSAGKWYKDITGSGDYKELKSGDLKERYDYLNKNATKIADLKGNPVEISYDLQDQKKVKETYNLTADKLQKEEKKRQAELAKKAPEEKAFTPGIVDGKLFNIADETQKKEYDQKYLEYVKSGRYEKDVNAVQKENDLNDVLSSIDSDLIGSNEDDVVSKLQGKLKKYDYLQVGPAGYGYDGIEIKNSITGESKFINLDNWTTDRDNEESKLLKGFLEVNIANDEYIRKQKQINDLRDRIEVEKKTNPYNVVFLQKELDELLPQLDKEREKKLDYMSKDKYRSAAAFDKYEIERINDNITKTILKKEDIKKEVSELNEYEKTVNESFKKGLITEEDYNTNYLPKINQRKYDIDNNVKLLKNDYRNISNEQSDIKNIAGNAFVVESERGNILSGTAFSFVQGMEQATRAVVEGDEYARGSAKGVFTSQFAPESFSEEYLSSENRNAFEQVVFGLANSGGSALAGAMTGSPVGATMGLFGASYTNFRDQMNSPEFKDVPEYQKILLAGSVGAVTSLLEKYGLTKAFSKSPVNSKVVNYIFSKSLKELPENATAEMIENSVEKQLKGIIANKVLKISGAGLIEYSTEAAQELTEIGAKELLNQAKGKKYFENPKTWGEVFQRANKAGMLGLLGGAGMQSLTQATLTAKQQLDKYQLQNIENAINSKDVKELFVLNIKDRILSGEITKDQGQAELNSLKESEGILRQIPDNLNSDDKYTSFKLINERENLRKQMEGKDPALVTPISNRVNEINNELKTISENAVKESTKPVEEVAAEGGGVQYQGVEQGQPKVREGEGPVGETAKPETDLGNRPIESRGVEEEVVVEAKPTKEEIQRDNVVRIQQEYNALTDRGKKGKQGNELKQRILSLASTLNYTVNENKGKISLVNEQGKKVVRTAFKEEIAEQPEYEIEVAKAAINSGLLAWDGDPLTMRWDSPLSWTDIRKGQKDISEGKYTTQPAKRLIIELNNQYKSGDFGMMQGSGKFINRTGIPVSQAFAEEALLPIPPEAEQEILEQRAAEEEQFVASEMIQEKTNLGKVYDYLDKLDKILNETLSPDKLNDITRVLPAAVMKVVVKALKVSVQAGMTLEQAIKDYAQKNNIEEKQITDSLYNMTDYQNKKTRERVTGEKQPKVKISKEAKEAKEISKRKVTKVAINDEYKAMITQIKLEAKAAREAKADLNTKRKILAAAIGNMVKTGKIKASQAAVLVKRVSSLNLDNPVMVERFTNYAQRVFERADYQQRLDDAFAIRKSIRKALKTDNQAEVVGMAKEFAKIDPSLVEDIDAYIEIADKVKNAVKPSRTKGEEVVLKEAANIAEISEYSKNEIDRQEQIRIDELLATYDFLEDVSKGMSFKELQDIVNLLKEKPNEIVDKEAKVKEFLKNRFDFMAGIVETMFKTGVDPMTGEEITFDEKQKDLMKKVLAIDLDEMSTREAIKIVEGVDNFLINQITSGLEAAASSYEGATNSKQLVNKGTKAKSLRLFFSNYVGKIYSEQLFSLPMLMEKMFDGVTNSIDVMSKMGLVKLINGVNKANRQHNEIIDEYSKQEFYKSKDFMDADNVYERGMLAFLKRNLVGNPTEMKAEFERRVRMVQESINKLIEDGDAKEQKMGEIYQKIYDKLGVAEMDMDVINSNASKNNLDAVNWWVNQWSQHYSDLSDISLSVYNTQLGSDLNYTPDKYKRLSSENQSLDEGAVEKNGAFAITIDYTDKKKTGVLMETTRPNFMPNGRYISLDFDTNNSKALKSALIDINTAAAIRQVDGFINSKSFKKLIPESEDRSIMTKRINTYIRRAKGKNIVPSDTIQYINKLTNYITSLGVGKALGGISQAVSQTIPVIVNTVVNSGRFDIADAKFNTWLNKTGLPISNRGLESQSTVESIDRKIDMTGTKTQEALKKIADLNQWYLKQFLVRPDVFVARSSFKSYYLQNLKRRGLSTDIDWTTHEIDMEAAEYAQAMIDRQQNISDSMLAGEFLASDDPIKQITRKVVLPFASFILNQKARMYNDLNTIFSETSTREDKAIAGRSLAGLAAELVTYQLIGFGIRRLYDTISASLLGDEDDEETKKKKLINATKYPIKSIVNDIVSPIPMADGIVTWGLNQALAQYPWMNDKEIKDAIKSRNKVLELKGEPSMTESEEKEFIDKIKEEATYQVFEDDFDRSYGMIGIVGSTYQELGEIGKLSTTGEFTDEYQGRETTKKLLEADREKVKYAVPFMIAYSTGLLPKDVGTISNNYINRIKKKAVTEKQYDRYETVQKDLGRNLKSWEIDMVKAKKESETAIDEIKFIERNGGLTERQGREYLKLMKAIGEPTVSDLTKIKNGQTTDQILK